MIYNNDNNIAKEQRVLISVCPCALHVHMMKNKNEGGYEPARDNATGDARYSLSTIVNYWPNWLTIMNDGHKNMCACKICTEMDDLHTAMKCKRRQICNAVKAEIEDMGRCREKLRREEELKNTIMRYSLMEVPITSTTPGGM